MSLKVYRICKMTGRSCAELVDEALHYRNLMRSFGIQVLDPVLIENVPYSEKPLGAHPDDMLKKFWLRDKQCLRDAHVAINFDASMKTTGGEHEQGLMRFGYWKPLVLVYPNGIMPFIARYENDLVVKNAVSACAWAYAHWGTRRQRIVWRLKMLNRSLPTFVFRQLKFLFQ